MDIQLLKARLVAFGLEALSLISVALVGVLTSPQFADLVTAHFGKTVATSLILLVVNGVVKHIRNISALNRVGGLGGRDGDPVILV